LRASDGRALRYHWRMFSLSIYLQGLLVVVAAACLTWLLSIYKKDVSIVDSLWPLLFLLLGASDMLATQLPGPRAQLLMGLLIVWSLRLSVYITWRNHGHGEDRRYQAIRARNQPRFEFKSLYLIFLLQAFMAWVISLPVHAAVLSHRSLGPLDGLGIALWLVGFAFEAGGDWQLARFKANPANQGRVMDRGLWRLTRHPNYFGDFCVWWAFYLIAAGGGAWWSFIGPVFMSVLLMRVSGVTLLEKDIGERRPEYADYVRRTNAFFPGKPR
jgi:steroid 5-alpha reductase family enzyme